MRALRTTLIGAMLGCASGAGTKAAPQLGPGVHVGFPKAVNDFRLVGVKEFERKADGTMLRYFSPANGVVADVYLYQPPARWMNCDSICADSAVAKEQDDFVRIVPLLIKQGYYFDARVTEEKTMPRPDSAKWLAGRYVQLATKDRHGDEQSEYYVYYLPYLYVKVRSDFLVDYPRRELVRKFSLEFVSLLQYAKGRAIQSAMLRAEGKPSD